MASNNFQCQNVLHQKESFSNRNSRGNEASELLQIKIDMIYFHIPVSIFLLFITKYYDRN